MKYLIIAIVVVSFQNIYAQDKAIVNEILDFYNNADLGYYEEMCQKQIDEYDKWVEDSFMTTWPDSFFIDGYAIKNGMEPYHKASHLDLKKEKKQFLLSISFKDMENFSRSDDIYDHIVIDTLSPFVIACMDDNGKVKGYVNYDYLGRYTRVEEFTLIGGSKRRAKKALENDKDVVSALNSFKPQALLIYTGLGNTFYYIKNSKIYVYDVYRKKGIELTEYAHEVPLIYLRTFGRSHKTITCQ
ncbi:MAG: hypothetical protein IJ604_13990 [Prevotella sp.]|nr:hypothetical protein [Prevotella sp.]MBR1464471.1 hypothetical protein [Prevotella sp.]